MKKTIIRSALILACALLTTTACMTATDRAATSSSGQWEVATVTEVRAAPPVLDLQGTAILCYVTVRVGDTEYVVLYIPANGMFEESVQYGLLGIDGLVLIGADTMKYNDVLGNTRELPILSRQTITSTSSGK